MTTANRAPIVTTRMSSKGQVVIPKEIRDHLGLCEGDDLTVEETEDTIVLRVTRNDASGLFGPPTRVEDVIGMLSHLVPRDHSAGSNREMREAAASSFAAHWRKKTART